MKILMIGNKESGKTTYMSCAFKVLNTGINGFFIQTDTETKNWFLRLSQQIKKGNYPDATDKRSNYHFNLYNNHRNVLDFDLIDYNGGIITDTSIESLRDDISSSHGMLIFLDSEALLKEDALTHRFRRIAQLISEKLETADTPLFSVIIVLTKYDKIPDGIGIEQVSKGIMPFVESANANEKLYVKMVPVSCSPKGFYNIDLPLLDILDSGLKLSYVFAAIEANLYAQQAQEYSAQIGIGDWVFSKLVGVKTNGQLAQENLEKARERLQLFENLQPSVERLSEHVNNYTLQYPQTNLSSRNNFSSTNSNKHIDL